MARNIALTFAACLTAAALSGCATGPSVIRGQAPSVMPAGSGQFHATCPQCQDGHCQMHRGTSVGNGPLLHHAGDVHGLLDMMGVGGLKPGAEWHPTHVHTFSYEPPEDLVYPAQNQPQAVVQYPYYTLKGPDDFFLGGTRR